MDPGDLQDSGLLHEDQVPEGILEFFQSLRFKQVTPSRKVTEVAFLTADLVLLRQALYHYGAELQIDWLTHRTPDLQEKYIRVQSLIADLTILLTD